MTFDAVPIELRSWPRSEEGIVHAGVLVGRGSVVAGLGAELVGGGWVAVGRGAVVGVWGTGLGG